MDERTLPNTSCLMEACRRLGISFVIHDRNANLIEVKLNRPLFFANTSTPFNDDSINKICRDKEFTYRLLHQVVQMPRTIGFFDPNCDPEYQHYRTANSRREVVDAIKKDFAFPVIVKRNAGAKGRNVFRCDNDRDLHRALKKIYHKQSRHYDYVALAQEYLPLKVEYRVIIFNQAVMLAYEKDISAAKFVGNLSPLHWQDARAKEVTSPELLGEISRFIRPIFSTLPVQYAGLDLGRTAVGEWFLIEINHHPGFSSFVRDNGSDRLTLMYQQILATLVPAPSLGYNKPDEQPSHLNRQAYPPQLG